MVLFRVFCRIISGAGVDSAAYSSGFHRGYRVVQKVAGLCLCVTGIAAGVVVMHVCFLAERRVENKSFCFWSVSPDE